MTLIDYDKFSERDDLSCKIFLKKSARMTSRD